MTNAKVQQQVGMAIRRIRRKRGISQEALARRVQIYRSYLSGVESGQRNPTIQTLSRFARALGVPLVHLFRFDSGPASTHSSLKRTKSKSKRRTMICA